jgi:hypothetical protein
MLDFSRNKEVFPVRGKRYYAHSDIDKVGIPYKEYKGSLAKFPHGKGGSKEFSDVGVEEFINSGGIRWTPEHLSFQIGKVPTQTQLSKMGKVYEGIPEWSRELSARSPALYTEGKFTPKNPSIAIDATINTPPYNRFFKEYDIWTPWKKIEKDILRFYETGKGPSLSISPKEFGLH